MNPRAERFLKYFLYLVALHSLIVGIGLIILPSSAFEYLGFESTFDRFFSTQGGVFHIAMSVGYAMPCFNLKRFKPLITFSIIVKFIAAVFLFLYFTLVSSGWIIILSAISDLVMGSVLLLLFSSLNKRNHFGTAND